MQRRFRIGAGQHRVPDTRSPSPPLVHQMMPAPEADQKLVDDLAETSEGLSWRLSPRMIAALGAPTASSSAAAVALSTSVPAAGASGAPASGAPMMSDARPPTQPRAGMRTRMGRNVGPIGGGTLASAAAGMDVVDVQSMVQGAFVDPSDPTRLYVPEASTLPKA